MFKLSLLSTALLSSFAFASPQNIHEYDVNSITLHSSIENISPFEQTVTAHFKAPDGKKLDIPAFYNDDGNYIVRTTFPQKGKWTYTIESSLKDINKKQGSIDVIDARKNHHGIVHVNPEHPKTFQYEDGKIYNPLGYEIDWLFHLNKKQTKSIVDYVAKNGFNQFIMNVYAYGTSGANNWGDAKINPKYNFNHVKEFPFLGSNTNPDYSSLNVDYFKSLDQKIAYLNEKGIQSHLLIYVWNKSVKWPTLNSKEDNRYFDYVVKRYSGYPNVIFDISKEAMDYGHANAQFINDRIERVHQLDQRKHMVTVHDFIYANSAFLGNNLDFMTVQEWAPNIGYKTKELIKMHQNQPVMNAENGAYEATDAIIFNGGYNNAITSLDRNYRIYFNQGYATHYWQSNAWFALNYEPQKLPKNLQPKLGYYKTFSKFMDSHPLTEWTPHEFNFMTWALTNKNHDLALYLQADAAGTKGHLTPFYNGKDMKLTWVNPLNGETYDAGTKHMNGIWFDVPKPEQLKGKPALLEAKVI